MFESRSLGNAGMRHGELHRLGTEHDQRKGHLCDVFQFGMTPVACGKFRGVELTVHRASRFSSDFVALHVGVALGSEG